VANFSSPRANLVEGDNGVSIEVLGRTGIRYSEGGRSCFVESEVLATPAIAVWPSGIRCWDPPHAEDPLTDDDRRRILQNIGDAFASQEWGLEIIYHRDAASVADEIVARAQEAGVTVFVHRRRSS
jgi:immunity protein 74 of polymorphic toxin system